MSQKVPYIVERERGMLIYLNALLIEHFISSRFWVHGGLFNTMKMKLELFRPLIQLISWNNRAPIFSCIKLTTNIQKRELLYSKNIWTCALGTQRYWGEKRKLYASFPKQGVLSHIDSKMHHKYTISYYNLWTTKIVISYLKDHAH